MRVRNISFKNYRNLHEDRLNFSKGINIIYGENAQGKTNILEAVWLLTGARAFRGTKDKDLISFGKEFASVKGVVDFKERENEIKIDFKDKKRTAEVNGINRGAATGIIGFFKAVIFSPEHLFLIKGGPENRRKFIDAAICQIKPSYTVQLIRYNKTLKHRNFLLKSIQSKPEFEDMLEIWDKKLSEYAGVIIKERLKYSGEVSNLAEKLYFEISNGEELKVNYAVQKEIKEMKTEEITEEYLKVLKETRKNDIFRGTTSQGPHRDEIDISINGKSARLFASQGQQRSAAIAMKLSEAEIAGKFAKEPPVILLDDILSELDERRQNQLFGLAGEAQMIITGCVKPKLKSKFKGFYVKDGRIFTEE